ncbi:hypothetical protein L6R52_16680 [Myxococcota bacterium]|nr:hypothetical protein [Myxococcota bacterium]
MSPTDRSRFLSRTFLGAAAILAATSSAACISTPIVRRLDSAPIDPSPNMYPSRECTLFVERPTDGRPEHERLGGAQTRVLVLVPLIPLMWFQQTEAQTYHVPQNIGGAEWLAGLERGLATTLSSSGICRITATVEEAELVLKTEVEHLFAVAYEQSGWHVSLGGFGLNDLMFYPSGQATMRFSLVRRTGQEVTSWRLAERTLFDPSSSGGSLGQVGSFITPNGDLNRASQIVETMRALYRRLPPTVDRAVALAHAAPRISDELPKQLFIVRQLEDYDFVEQALIDTATGRVEASAIVPRREPVVSRPGEWVVSPYQPSYLVPAEYRRLVARLGERFDVRFEDNVTAARFFGLREEHASVR